MAVIAVKNPEVEVLIAGMQMPDYMGPDFTARFKAVFPEVAKDSKVILIPFLLEGAEGSMTGEQILLRKSDARAGCGRPEFYSCLFYYLPPSR